MPSIRKRIGYLPSVNIQKIITKIASHEGLSQSKVVGILVEEALIARGVFDIQNTNDMSSKSYYKRNFNNSSYTYSDLDELISDKGVTYNTKKYTHKEGNLSTKPKETINKELFEQFKQFLLFQKMQEEK